MVRLIIFLIRRRFGLKRYQRFRFTNQKSPYNWYYFTDTNLMKAEFVHKDGVCKCHDRPANVKLNYLLSDECHIEKYPVKVSWS